MRCTNKIRKYMLVGVVILMTACGEEFAPKVDIWSGYYALFFGLLGGGSVQYVVAGPVVLDIYINGKSTGVSGLALYLDGTFGILKLVDKDGQESGGIFFLDESKNAGILFSGLPPSNILGFMAIIQKTHSGASPSILAGDVLKNWTGVTKETDGDKTATSPTIVTCNLVSSCVYTRNGNITGTITSMVFNAETKMWTGYYSEPATGRSGDSLIGLTQDKSSMMMVNCDSDNHYPIGISDCTYYIGFSS